MLIGERVSHRLCSVDCATVTWNLPALVHAIVPDDAGDAQAIIGKNPAAAFCLRDPMFTRVARSQNCRFVPEKRERRDFAWLVQALKTVDPQEGVDLLEQRPHVGGDTPVFLLA